MAISTFAQFQIHENPNVWYVAVGRNVTIADSMKDIRESAPIIEDNRISSVIVDFRAASFQYMEGEFFELAKRVHMYSPLTVRSAILTGKRNLEPATLMTLKLKELGHGARCMVTWSETCNWLGCPEAEDPIPRTRVYV